SAAADPSGSGEGQSFLGFKFVTTNSQGAVNFSFTFPVAVPTGHVITATATGTGGNTSEFSPAKPIGPRIATGADAGEPPIVHIYDAPTGQLQSSFQPYPNSFTGGVRVAVGDVSGDGLPDVVTAPGPGAALPVEVFDATSGQPIAGPLASFFPFGQDFANG